MGSSRGDTLVGRRPRRKRKQPGKRRLRGKGGRGSEYIPVSLRTGDLMEGITVTWTGGRQGGEDSAGSFRHKTWVKKRPAVRRVTGRSGRLPPVRSERPRGVASGAPPGRPRRRSGWGSGAPSPLPRNTGSSPPSGRSRDTSAPTARIPRTRSCASAAAACIAASALPLPSLPACHPRLHCLRLSIIPERIGGLPAAPVSQQRSAATGHPAAFQQQSGPRLLQAASTLGRLWRCGVGVHPSLASAPAPPARQNRSLLSND